MRFLPRLTPLTIRRLDLKPGDRIIITTQKNVTPETADRIVTWLKTRLHVDPQVNPVVFMDGGTTLTVLSAEDGDLS